jgi:tripartite-type tricarboxylate transporter receptor subunit TctC
MTVSRRAALQSLSTFGLLAAGLSSARAQGKFPSQPIKIIVPYPAGGPYDGIPRLVAQFLGDKQGWTFVIENRAGASGLTGILAAKQMPPDGHTLVITTSSTHGSAPAINKALRYDPYKDLDPVILLGEAPMALLVRSELPVKTVQDLIELLRKNPGKYNYASGGYASQHHLASSMMLYKAGLPQDIAAHVPFLGLAPAVASLVAGDVQFMFTTTGAVAQFIETGKLRAIAVSSRSRSRRMPSIPAMSELGFGDFNIVPWCGVAAPSGTPKDILLLLNGAINAALNDQTVKSRIASLDYDVRGGSPEDYTKFFVADIKQYTQLTSATGIHQKD